MSNEYEDYKRFLEWKRAREAADTDKQADVADTIGHVMNETFAQAVNGQVAQFHPAALPAPIVLQEVHAKAGAELMSLIASVDATVGLLNRSIATLNTDFWQGMLTEYKMDVENYHWALEGGTLVPKPKPEAPAGHRPRIRMDLGHAPKA